jgi:hypothetical protein
MQEVRVKTFARASLSLIAFSILFVASSVAADVCGARVDVKQIGMTPNEDGTRTVRYRASVQTDQVTCAKVSFSILRSYIKPDGTAFEDVIPVDIQVPGRAVDVEGETLANTRRLIYWRAEKITCEPCAKGEVAATNVPPAPVPATARRRPATGGAAAAPAAPSSDEGGMKLPGKKAVLIGGAAAAVGGAALVLGGSSSAAAPDAEATPTPSPGPAATNPPASTPAPTPTPTPAGPRVFPGAPPAPPASAEEGDITLLSTDPPNGNSVPASKGTVGVQLQVFIDKVTPNMRLEVDIFSGGETCLRDTSAPLDIAAKQPTILVMSMPNVRRCTAPFRTTLVRALLIDAAGTKLTRDFPLQLDFMP